ncbi:TRM44 [Sanghuangporus sanghuang]
MSQSVRPRFTPLPCMSDNSWDPLEFATGRSEWIPVCCCPVEFPLDTFEPAVSQLIHHPEYNSSLILRSEIIEESDKIPADGVVPQLQNLRFKRTIHRRLLPRRPGRDPPIEQNCSFYSPAAKNAALCDADSAKGGSETPVTCVVLTPRLEKDAQMPYYHPAVFHIAFRYLSSAARNDAGRASSKHDQTDACVRIEVVLQPDAPDPKDVNSRLYRTCLALLETVHRYCWGVVVNYRKQAHHDCIISREEYQDLYLVMRERYKHLVNQWHENTDPLKHVYEDIGIATFLMLLWKQGTGEASKSVSDSENVNDAGVGEKKPWRDWPRPRGGFLDFGCGNGLLVHILVSEGYAGEGIDVRARQSWRHYPPETQAHLHVHALNPLDLPISSSESVPVILNPFLKSGVFIIANHADELSPWTPVLATLSAASGFLSIPCCAWSFDARFDRAQMSLYNSGKINRDAPFALTPPDDTEVDVFIESLRLGGMSGDALKSAYAAYRVWLACLGIQCGWIAESEMLRIPSTRNWALVGRKRCGDESRSIENALAIIQQVRERGLFKTRRPEGKAGDH